MGMRPHETAGDLNKMMRATTASEVKSVAALFLTHCEGAD